jgi:hypothetical protein
VPKSVMMSWQFENAIKNKLNRCESYKLFTAYWTFDLTRSLLPCVVGRKKLSIIAA